MPKVRLRDLDPAIFLHKVGIGTDSPTYMLDVVGGNVRIGKTTNGRLVIENSSGTAKIQLDSNGVSYINGGNCAIGTALPEAKLHVDGGSGGAEIIVNGAVGSDACSVRIGQGTAGSATDRGTFLTHYRSNNEFRINNGGETNSIITFYTRPSSGQSVEKMRIDSDGQSYFYGQLNVAGGSGSASNRLNMNYNANNGVAEIAPNSSHGHTELKFSTCDSSGTKSEAMRIHSDGHVGINSPSNANARLVVAGHSDAGDSTCAIHIIDNDSTGGSSVPNISFRSGASTQIYGIRGNDTFGLTFRNSSDATKICFDDDGNIGVGIHENISAKLQVEGGRIKVRQSDSYSGFSIAHESGGYAYLINSDNTYITFMVGGSASSNQILTLQDEKIELNREAQFKGTTRLDPRNGGHHIIETAFNLDNHNSSTGESYNIADITRDTNNWGYGHYIVEVHANYYSGGSYARYYIIYAASNSEVKTIDSPVGANTGYNVYLAGETTLTGNVKKASIMVDVPAYGNATVKLTHCGVSVDTGSLSHLSGRIKYNI